MVDKIIVPRRPEDWFTVGTDRNGKPTIEFTLRAFRFFESVTDNSNVSLDDIAKALAGLTEFDDIFSESAQDQLRDDVVVTAADYTTIGDQIIVATDELTVTLNATPEDRELVKIHANNGRVDIDANGKTINGETDAIIRRNFTTWDILYIVELDSWIII